MIKAVLAHRPSGTASLGDLDVLTKDSIGEEI